MAYVYVMFVLSCEWLIAFCNGAAQNCAVGDHSTIIIRGVF